MPRPVQNRLMALTLAALGLCGSAFAESAAGHWRGESDDGQKVELYLTDLGGGKIGGRLRSVMGGVDLPLTGRQDGTGVTLEISGINWSFSGTLDGELDGHITRPWGKVDTSFDRDESLAPDRRKQDPVPPLPYEETKVTFASKDGGITLAGTLSLPSGAGPFPAVVLITPDGPQDRDATAASHRPHAVLADALVRAGIAVLRYDDRGIGQSSGLYDSATTSGLAKDASGALAFLKGRADIDPARIAVLGRNNGAAIAAKASVNGAAAAVLWSAPCSNGRDLANRQAEDGMRQAGESESSIADRVRIQNRLFDEVLANPNADPETLNTRLIEIVRDEAGVLSMFVSDRTLSALTRRLITPWFRDFLTYDPAGDYAKMQGPVLALYGEKDRINPPELCVAKVKTALGTGGAQASSEVLSGLGAILVTPPADPRSSPYKREETLAQAGIDAIVAFLKSALKVGV